MPRPGMLVASARIVFSLSSAPFTAASGAMPVGEIQLSCFTGPWGPDGLIHSMHAVHAANFDGIECPAEVIRRFEDRLPVFEEILEHDNLRLSGIHQPLNFFAAEQADELVERAANAARFLRAAGRGYLLAVPVDAVDAPLTDEQWATACAILDEAGERCRELDIDFCFVPSARSFGAAEREIKRLLVTTKAENVFLCVDTAELALAGVDPAKIIKTHSARLRAVRLREASGAKRRPGAAFPPPPAFGRGIVKFDAVAKALLDMRYSGWVSVDVTGESGDPAKAAENGYRHIFRRSGLFAL